MKGYNTRYWIITLHIVEKGQIVEFSDRIPTHLKILKALLVNASRKEGDLEDIEQLGELSIQLNSRKSAPIHLFTEYNKRPKNSREYELEEEIQPNQIVTGYYRDAQKTVDTIGNFKAYTLKIYFKCKTQKD